MNEINLQREKPNNFNQIFEEDFKLNQEYTVWDKDANGNSEISSYITFLEEKSGYYKVKESKVTGGTLEELKETLHPISCLALLGVVPYSDFVPSEEDLWNHSKFLTISNLPKKVQLFLANKQQIPIIDEDKNEDKFVKLVKLPNVIRPIPNQQTPINFEKRFLQPTHITPRKPNYTNQLFKEDLELNEEYTLWIAIPNFTPFTIAFCEKIDDSDTPGETYKVFIKTKNTATICTASLQAVGAMPYEGNGHWVHSAYLTPKSKT